LRIQDFVLIPSPDRGSFFRILVLFWETRYNYPPCSEEEFISKKFLPNIHCRCKKYL